jgi:hypothetical protein
LDQCCGSITIHTPQSRNLFKVYPRRCPEDSTKGHGRLGEEVHQGHGLQATSRICLCQFLNPDTTLLSSRLPHGFWSASSTRQEESNCKAQVCTAQVLLQPGTSRTVITHQLAPAFTGNKTNIPIPPTEKGFTNAA